MNSAGGARCSGHKTWLLVCVRGLAPLSLEVEAVKLLRSAAAKLFEAVLYERRRLEPEVMPLFRVASLSEFEHRRFHGWSSSRAPVNASSRLSCMGEPWRRESTEPNSLRLTPAICAATSWLTCPTSYHFAAAAARNSVANSPDSRSRPAKVSSGRSISTRFIYSSYPP